MKTTSTTWFPWPNVGHFHHCFQSTYRSLAKVWNCYLCVHMNVCNFERRQKKMMLREISYRTWHRISASVHNSHALQTVTHFIPFLKPVNPTRCTKLWQHRFLLSKWPGFIPTTREACAAAPETHHPELLLHQSLLSISYILMCKKVHCIPLYEHLLSHLPKNQEKTKNNTTCMTSFLKPIQKSKLKSMQNNEMLTFIFLHCLNAKVNYLNRLRGNFFFFLL